MRQLYLLTMNRDAIQLRRLGADDIRWTGGGTVTFKADTSVNLTEKPASAFTFAETDGVFSGMPVAANMRRWKMVMSQDRKSIRIVPPGLMVIVK